MKFQNSSNPDILVDKKIKEIKKGKEDSKENFDLSDIEKNSQDGFLLSAIGSMPETPSFETDLCNVDFSANVSPTIQDATVSLQAVSLDKQETNSTMETVRVEKEKEVEISSCVVCDKKFKSKSCMNKHLRSVHSGRYNHFSFVNLLGWVEHSIFKIGNGFINIFEIKINCNCSTNFDWC